MPQRYNLEVVGTKMQSLLDAFEAHPENQPPQPNPTIYFTFDFIRNTHNQLKAIDSAKYASGDKASEDAITEIIGRNSFSNLLISDTSGKTAAMMGGGGQSVDFGPDIRQKAQDLASVSAEDV